MFYLINKKLIRYRGMAINFTISTNWFSSLTISQNHSIDIRCFVRNTLEHRRLTITSSWRPIAPLRTVPCRAFAAPRQTPFLHRPKRQIRTGLAPVVRQIIKSVQLWTIYYSLLVHCCRTGYLDWASPLILQLKIGLCCCTPPAGTVWNPLVWSHSREWFWNEDDD